MSGVKDSLLGDPPKYSSYGALQSQTVITVESSGSPNSDCVSFHNVSYVASSCFGQNPKVILNSVSGLLPKGLNGIMGPTGSGKTSLLDILAGRKDKNGLRGMVLVNGQQQPKNFKCMSGYVVQDDIVMGTLSVRENLHFSAALRLPSHMTHIQRKERVEKIIDELGLTNCANTKIGNEFIRGVSGGERKRTNIGMELIIKPQVLFLDEPTTGLDANTAISVVQLLKDLSIKSNNIVIMSIHQPRYSIYKLLDTLTLLSAGNIVYHGEANLALDYFSGAGFQCEEHDNPADFFLDTITYCEVTGNCESSRSYGKKAELGGEKDLPDYYKRSADFKNLQEKLTPMLNDCTTVNTKGQRAASYATCFIWQFLIVALRSMVNLLRNPMNSIYQWIIKMILALLVGLIYFRLNEKDYNPQTVITDRIGALFFVVTNQVFGNISAIDLFIKEKAIFIHENISGYYRVSVFFLAKVVTDLIPMRIIPLCLFSVITYFMIGFQLDPGKFFIFLLTLTLTSVTAVSLAFAISSRFSSVAIANLLIGLCLVLFMLSGGFLIALSSLPKWSQWLKYVSLFRYALEALIINEIKGQLYCASSTSTNITTYDNCTNGTAALEHLGYQTDITWIWYDQIGLVTLSLVFLLITYINLLTTKKLK